MAKFNVMISTEEEKIAEAKDFKYKPKGVVHCQVDFRNEMLAAVAHRNGTFDGQYPKGSWLVPVD